MSLKSELWTGYCVTRDSDKCLIINHLHWHHPFRHSHDHSRENIKILKAFLSNMIWETWSLIGLKLIQALLRSTGPFFNFLGSMMKRLELMLREKFQIGLKSNTRDGIWSRALGMRHPVHICHRLGRGFEERWYRVLLLAEMSGCEPLIGWMECMEFIIWSVMLQSIFHK